MESRVFTGLKVVGGGGGGTAIASSWYPAKLQPQHQPVTGLALIRASKLVLAPAAPRKKKSVVQWSKSKTSIQKNTKQKKNRGSWGREGSTRSEEKERKNRPGSIKNNKNNNMSYNRHITGVGLSWPNLLPSGPTFYCTLVRISVHSNVFTSICL